MKIFIVIALAILAIILGPIAIIWSMNVLFPSLAIPFSLDTWCAVVILSSLFTTNVNLKK